MVKKIHKHHPSSIAKMPRSEQKKAPFSESAFFAVGIDGSSWGGISSSDVSA
jgi:hypothetical protein